MTETPSLPIPAIVAVGYNRPRVLERLLGSVAAGDYPRGVEVPLLISLDRCPDEGPRAAVREVAEAFAWEHGPKRILPLAESLGLKRHILACGDLSEEHGSVIVLEDDSWVAPGYYRYTREALAAFAADPRIAGVALYSHRAHPCTWQPFEPLHDGADNYFLRFTCSWGQAWTADQWRAFREWLAVHPALTGDEDLPEAVFSWPDSSWVRHHLKYLVETGRTIAYPRVSQATNFGDPGTHVPDPEDRLQVPCALPGGEPRFVGLDASCAVYDQHFEPDAALLQRLAPDLAGHEFVCDLSGARPLSRVQTPLVLTRRRASEAALRFADSLLPPEMNVVAGLPGEGISLAPVTAVDPAPPASSDPAFARFDREYRLAAALRYTLRKAARKVSRALGGSA